MFKAYEYAINLALKMDQNNPKEGKVSGISFEHSQLMQCIVE